MRSLVVCESWFGNTLRLAEEVARVLGRRGDVELLGVDDPLPDLAGCDLLVVGAPTHVHGLSSEFSRRSALEQRGEEGDPGEGVRGWLHRLPREPHVAVAVFDTRVDRSPLLVGSAAHGIARRLRRSGVELLVPPESFFVADTPGPLLEGELERAAAWAETLTLRVPAPVY